MKMRITDLLDSYRDRDDLIGADERSDAGTGSIVEIHETKHRMNWTTFAGIAAALAVIVGAAFLLIPKLKQSAGPMSEGNTTESAATETPTDSRTDEEKYGLKPGFYVLDTDDFAHQPCMNLYADEKGELRGSLTASQKGKRENPW